MANVRSNVLSRIFTIPGIDAPEQAFLNSLSITTFTQANYPHNTETTPVKAKFLYFVADSLFG